MVLDQHLSEKYLEDYQSLMGDSSHIEQLASITGTPIHYLYSLNSSSLNRNFDYEKLDPRFVKKLKLGWTIWEHLRIGVSINTEKDNLYYQNESYGSYNKVYQPLDISIAKFPSTHKLRVLDLSLRQKLNEDEIYSRDTTLQMVLRRGCTFLEISSYTDKNDKPVKTPSQPDEKSDKIAHNIQQSHQKQSHFCIIRRGLPKFFDLDILDLLKLSNPDIPDNSKHTAHITSKQLFDRIKNVFDSKFRIEIVSLKKENGENAQISYIEFLDCWVICSKNVSMIVKDENDLEKPKYTSHRRYTFSRMIVSSWFEHLRNLSDNQVSLLKKVLSENTIVGELVGNTNRDNLIQSKSGPGIIFYAIVPHHGCVQCWDPILSLNFMKEVGLRTVQINSNTLCENLGELLSCLHSIKKKITFEDIESSGEGCVCYLVCKADSSKSFTMGLVKVKSFNYLMLRRIREKLKNFCDPIYLQHLHGNKGLLKTNIIQFGSECESTLKSQLREINESALTREEQISLESKGQATLKECTNLYEQCVYYLSNPNSKSQKNEMANYSLRDYIDNRFQHFINSVKSFEPPEFYLNRFWSRPEKTSHTVKKLLCLISPPFLAYDLLIEHVIKILEQCTAKIYTPIIKKIENEPLTIWKSSSIILIHTCLPKAFIDVHTYFTTNCNDSFCSLLGLPMEYFELYFSPCTQIYPLVWGYDKRGIEFCEACSDHILKLIENRNNPIQASSAPKLDPNPSSFTIVNEHHLEIGAYPWMPHILIESNQLESKYLEMCHSDNTNFVLHRLDVKCSQFIIQPQEKHPVILYAWKRLIDSFFTKIKNLLDIPFANDYDTLEPTSIIFNTPENKITESLIEYILRIIPTPPIQNIQVISIFPIGLPGSGKSSLLEGYLKQFLKPNETLPDTPDLTLWDCHNYNDGDFDAIHYLSSDLFTNRRLKQLGYSDEDNVPKDVFKGVQSNSANLMKKSIEDFFGKLELYIDSNYMPHLTFKNKLSRVLILVDRNHLPNHLFKQIQNVIDISDCAQLNMNLKALSNFGKTRIKNIFHTKLGCILCSPSTQLSPHYNRFKIPNTQKTTEDYAYSIQEDLIDNKDHSTSVDTNIINKDGPRCLDITALNYLSTRCKGTNNAPESCSSPSGFNNKMSDISTPLKWNFPWNLVDVIMCLKRITNRSHFLRGFEGYHITLSFLTLFKSTSLKPHSLSCHSNLSSTFLVHTLPTELNFRIDRNKPLNNNLLQVYTLLSEIIKKLTPFSSYLPLEKYYEALEQFLNDFELASQSKLSLEDSILQFARKINHLSEPTTEMHAALKYRDTKHDDLKHPQFAHPKKYINENQSNYYKGLVVNKNIEYSPLTSNTYRHIGIDFSNHKEYFNKCCSSFSAHLTQYQQTHPYVPIDNEINQFEWISKPHMTTFYLGNNDIRKSSPDLYQAAWELSKNKLDKKFNIRTTHFIYTPKISLILLVQPLFSTLDLSSEKKNKNIYNSMNSQEQSLPIENSIIPHITLKKKKLTKSFGSNIILKELMKYSEIVEFLDISNIQKSLSKTSNILTHSQDMKSVNSIHEYSDGGNYTANVSRGGFVKFYKDIKIINSFKDIVIWKFDQHDETIIEGTLEAN